MLYNQGISVSFCLFRLFCSLGVKITAESLMYIILTKPVVKLQISARNTQSVSMSKKTQTGYYEVEARKRKEVTLLAKVWKSDQKIIGENIKKARKAAKLTQEQFAEEMGGSCSNKVISRYEKGEVEMGVQTLIDIAENLEVPVDSLMPERVQVHTEPEDDEMSKLFSGLNAENKEMLLKMARMMAQNEALKMAI